MSAKPSTSKRADRIKPNTVLTRHKSALMKRQLRNKDDSIRRISQITQLLRSPAKDKSTKSPKTLKKNVKSPEKKVMKREEEIVSDKLKRKIKRKKVILKPKVELKKIGSKRKLAVPHKGISSPAAKSPSLAELVALADAELGDEDLMEILTCESPVWWEDPPHQDYDEDPIYNMILSPVEDIKQSNSHIIKSATKTPDSSIDLPNVRLSDDRFMKKRTKLEHLLGNIKKNLNTTHEKGKKEINTTVKEDTNEIDDKEIKIETGNDEDELIEKERDEKIESNNENKDTSETSKRDKNNSECAEYAFITDDIIKNLENMDIPIESGIHQECSVDEDNKDVDPTDPIKDLNAGVLEKKDNPIENTDEVSEETVSDEIKMETLDVKELVDDKVNTIEETQKMDCVNQVSAEEEKKLNEAIKMYFVDAVSDGGKESSVVCENSDVINASTSKAKFSITSIEVTSPMSVRSSDDTADTTSLVSNSDADTISDSNIKYIDDSKAAEANKDEKHNTENIESSDRSKDENEKIFLKQVGATNEGKNSKPKINREQLMTVYKIITNDEYRESYLKNIENGNDKNKVSNVNPEIVDTENTTSLDTFFRHKHNHQKRKKMEILNQILDKHIKVSDSEPKSSEKEEIISVCEQRDPEYTALNIVSDVKSAKYCLKCSSIFETETCSYCIKRGQVSHIGCHTCKLIS